MSRLAVLGIAACSALAATANAAECLVQPVPFTAHYAVHASRGLLALDGDATVRFARSGNDYTLTSSMNAAGLLSSRQESRGALSDAGLVPVRYSETASRRATMSLSIDWRERRVTFADGTEASAKAALQDRASLMVQLALAARAQPQAQMLEFQVAGLRRISTYKFVRRGSERLELPAGTIDAERFERIDEHEDDHFDVWLAPAHCGFPVRIRLRDHRGHDIDQRLRELRYD